jgi:hypothetical protein
VLVSCELLFVQGMKLLPILIKKVGVDPIIATKIIMELEQRFPPSHVMDAFCIVYLQFWLGEVSNMDLQHHLGVLKIMFS